MNEDNIEVLNECRDTIESVSTTLSEIAQTKKLSDKLDRLNRDLEAIIDELGDDPEEY